MDVYQFIKHIMAELGYQNYHLEPYNCLIPDITVNNVQVIDGNLNDGIYFLVTHGGRFQGMTIIAANAHYTYKDGDDLIPFLNYFRGNITITMPLPGAKSPTIQFIRAIPLKES